MKVLLPFLLLFPSIGFAEGLDCLLGAKGQSVRWDGDWQRDLSDTNVLYRIETVQALSGLGGQPEAHLRLVTSEPAKLKRREAVIRLEHAAELFCRRIVSPPPSIGKLMVTKVPGGSQRFIEPEGAGQAREDSELVLLPYRALIEGRWVPARPQPGVKSVRCMTELADYSCSEEDLKRHIAKKGVTRSPRLLRKTAHPFIRFTSSGWVREDAWGLGEEAPLSTCEVGERQFTCLSSEKDRYGNLLKRLPETVSGGQSS